MTNVDQVIADFFNRAYAQRVKICEIADEAGLTRVTMSNWRSGRHGPQLGAWMAANEALDRLVEQKIKA